MTHAAGEARTLAERIAGIPEWYHTLELSPGVVTPGWFDLRTLPARLPFPASLQGGRCLDVGTFDGFWAFEMERRGAAEVLAIDVLDPQQWDWPVGSEDQVVAAIARRKAQGAGFLLAKEALGSAVERLELSVYDLDPGKVGQFDFVYVGSLLLHLRDPVRALERVAAVCRGEVLLVDAIDLPMTRLHPRRALAWLDGVGRPWWWKPNLAGLVQMARVAGLEPVRDPAVVYMPTGAGFTKPQVRARMLLRPQGVQDAVTAWKGEPHAAVLARRRSGVFAAG